MYIIDRKMLDYDVLTNIDEAVAFLERNLRLAYEIKDIRRKEILEIPKDVLREAIINAVAHRDYFVEGAHVVVEIFDDRVDISNPGGLPKGLKPEDFGFYSVPRNPLIASLLHRCNYIEKAGTGIQRMRDGMKEAGLALPTFKFSGFFTATFPRGTKLEIETKLKQLFGEIRLKRMYALLSQLHEKGKLQINSIASQLDTTPRTIRRDMELMEENGWVKSIGSTNNKSYQITDEGIEKVNTLC